MLRYLHIPPPYILAFDVYHTQIQPYAVDVQTLLVFSCVYSH